MKNLLKDVGNGVGIFFAVVASIVVVSLVGLGVDKFIVPLFINQDQQNFRQSYGTQQAYIDAARTAVAQAAGTTGGQQQALYTQACQLVGNVGVQNLPIDLASFASTHC